MFLALFLGVGVQYAGAEDDPPAGEDHKDEKKADEPKDDHKADEKKDDDHKDEKKVDDKKDEHKDDDHKADEHKAGEPKADAVVAVAGTGGGGGDDDLDVEAHEPTDDDPAGTGSRPGDRDGDGIPDDQEDEDGNGIPDYQEDRNHNGIPDGQEDADGDGIPDFLEDENGNGIPDIDEVPGDLDGDGIPDDQQEFDEDDPPTDPFDADGDGVVDPEEKELQKEFVTAFKNIPNEPDAQALKRRKEGKALSPSLSIAGFRKLVQLSKKVVLAKMETKIAKKTAKKMKKFFFIIVGVSLAGFLLLLMPLFLRKKYPGQGGVLFKYSALAAGVFVLTVNVFGGIVYGYKTVQNAVSGMTNPQVALAAGTFDTLDRNAEDYLTTGKELFGPTLDQLRKHPDKPPVVAILENGQRLVKDGTDVFTTVVKLYKSIDFIIAMLPIVLLIVTLILFVLALLPTLKAIVALPAAAASGNSGAGREVLQKAFKRLKGEILATLCTVGFLVVLSLVSGLALSIIVGPALDAFLRYFAMSVNYLLFASGSSGLVFVAMFGIILFLLLNLLSLMLSMIFFLGKTQKVFQARFCDDIPLSTHSRWFKWGSASVVLVQLFPVGFAFAVAPILKLVKDHFIGAELNPLAVSWKGFMLSAPALLVVMFVILFWAARGLKALKFVATYKIPKLGSTEPPPVAQPAEQVPPQ
ncbi:MAG: hypothetical protein KIT31_36870 [Deltaproteobacteria bacterium]|nr:hypothetical protein [Deltaproteobacteria bacterium]